MLSQVSIRYILAVLVVVNAVLWGILIYKALTLDSKVSNANDPQSIKNSPKDPKMIEDKNDKNKKPPKKPSVEVPEKSKDIKETTKKPKDDDTNKAEKPKDDKSTPPANIEVKTADDGNKNVVIEQPAVAA